MKLTKKTNTKNRFIFGYDSRTGLKGILEGIEKITENTNEKQIIEITPHNVIPSIENTITDFDFFKEQIEEKSKNVNCEIIFSTKWDKYSNIEEDKTVKVEQKKTSHILKQQLLRKKPIEQINKEQLLIKEEKKHIETKKITDITNSDNLSNFKELEESVRCGFTRALEGNTTLTHQINKSGKVIFNNGTLIVSNHNNGIIEASDGCLILRSGFDKGIIVFDNENISNKIEKESSYVVFSEKNIVKVEKL